LFDRCVREFARRPGGAGPPDLRGRAAGEVDDLDDLLGGEGAGRAGPGRVGQGGGDDLNRSADESYMVSSTGYVGFTWASV